MNYADRLTEEEKNEATELQCCVAFNWLDSDVIRSGIVSFPFLGKQNSRGLISSFGIDKRSSLNGEKKEKLCIDIAPHSRDN